MSASLYGDSNDIGALIAGVVTPYFKNNTDAIIDLPLLIKIAEERLVHFTG